MAAEKKICKELGDETPIQEDDSKTISEIFKLNDDCMLHIFSFLSIKERLRIQRVCKKWKALIAFPWNDIKRLEINFSRKSDDQDIEFSISILKQVLQHCGTSLTNLKLVSYYGRGFTNSVIKLLINKCPNVRSLDTTGLYITRKMMESMTDFRGLTHFSIGDCWHDCDEHVSKIFSANKNLKSVEFEKCSKLNGRCLSSLPTDLESLGFGPDCEFESDEICKVLPKLRKLHTLIIGNDWMSESIDKLLQELPIKSNLKELHFPGYAHWIAEPHCSTIENFCLTSNLQKLTLTGSYILHDEQLKVIGKHCKSLVYASLSNSTNVTDRGWRDFVKFSNLEELQINHLDKLTSYSLSHINMPSLKKFRCSNCCHINNNSLAMLMLGAKNLEHIEVFEQPLISLHTLVNTAKDYTETRTTTKVLKLVYESERSVPNLYRASTRLMVEVKNFRLKVPKKILVDSSSESSSPDSTSSSDSSSDDDSSSSSDSSSSYQSSEPSL